MKIDLHTIIYRAAKTKFNINTGSIVQDGDLFTLTSDDDRTFNQTDFTQAELDQAKTQLEAENAQAEAEAVAAKASAKAKLEALGLTLDDLAALGL